MNSSLNFSQKKRKVQKIETLKKRRLDRELNHGLQDIPESSEGDLFSATG
jgi:hypothetical protein